MGRGEIDIAEAGRFMLRRVHPPTREAKENGRIVDEVDLSRRAAASRAFYVERTDLELVAGRAGVVSDVDGDGLELAALVEECRAWPPHHEREGGKDEHGRREYPPGPTSVATEDVEGSDRPYQASDGQTHKYEQVGQQWVGPGVSAER